MASKQVEQALESIAVLIVDGNAFTRRLTRTMLVNLGLKTIHEASDGVSGIDAIQNASPDVMILDWDTPILNGREVMRIVRAPGVFPKAGLPIIMLTDRGLQSRVTLAIRLGAHEVLDRVAAVGEREPALQLPPAQQHPRDFLETLA